MVLTQRCGEPGRIRQCFQIIVCRAHSFMAKIPKLATETLRALVDDKERSPLHSRLFWSNSRTGRFLHRMIARHERAIMAEHDTEVTDSPEVFTPDREREYLADERLSGSDDDDDGEIDGDGEGGGDKKSSDGYAPISLDGTSL